MAMRHLARHRCNTSAQAEGGGAVIQNRHLKREKSSPWGWGKLCDFVRNSKLNRFFRREPKVIVVEVRPLLIGHIDMLPQDRFSISVEQNGTLGESLYSLSVGRSGGCLGSVNHKARRWTYNAPFGT